MAKDYSKMNKDELLKEIKELRSRKSYGLVWEDKPEDVVEQCETKIPILSEDEKRNIEKDLEKPNNLLIEGDNYHSLSVLNYTHKKKVDLIYIDPPYNTGAKDWKYNNNFVDDNDQYRHSKWLSMMNNRLKIAKNLLSPAGVLVCTIDKYEQATLALLLAEIFPNYEIVCVTIVHNPAGTQGNNFSYTNEYAFFVFPKNGTYINKTTRTDSLVSSFRDWGPTSLRSQAKTCFYPIIIKDNKIVGFGDVCSDDFHPKKSNIKQKDGSFFVYPIDKEGKEKKWVFSRKSVEKIKEQLFCKETDGEISIFRSKDEASYKTVWDDTKYYANIYGSKLLNRIIDSKFPFPKSLYAVMDCIRAVIHDKNDSVILDFFAGSGTTGHAVLELNKEDGGKRRFILCTNNENKIAEEVTYPRIKNVIEGYGDVEGIPANLRYYKTEFVDVESVHNVSDQKKIELTYQAGRMIALREDTLEETEKNDWWQIFTDKNGRTTAIYFKEDKEKLDKLVDKIKKSDQAALYIFSWGKNEYKNEYTEYKNIRVEDIPEPILEVYKEINKK